ncbi:tetratricopeptide repeat protein [Geomicrobium sp. JCM 19039]|uniref:tetratricopeptide repeat protein n=1 Tax=Geomicrobium sp. JCM 19039 TaxID=1460636 RepID=UPI00045F1927|nr:tetratricopeptide repeat protein [Geomicrobium sp. JCM 19039]GAK10422.1 response regulator aspartate phosphatase [Geomicrobium sp. JCM 19039]
MNQNSQSVLLDKLKMWFKFVGLLDIDQAEQYRSSIRSKLQNELLPEAFESIYSLIEFRHQLVIGTLRNHPIRQKEYLVDAVGEMFFNDFHKYVFFSNQGIIHFNNNNYMTALDCYREAETALIDLDSIEQANFYYRFGQIYYRLHQNIAAFSYFESAAFIYELEPPLRYKLANCQNYIAAIYSELSQIEDAERMFFKAMETSKGITNTTGS